MGMAPAAIVWLAIGGVLLRGIMQPFANGPANAAEQASVDPAIQGRVLSLIAALTVAAAPLGLFFAGPLGDRLSIQLWFILLGGACILLGLSGFLSPPLVRLGETPCSE